MKNKDSFFYRNIPMLRRCIGFSVNLSIVIMHHILDSLLGMAMKQINDPQESDEAAAETNFGIIFSVVKNYINQDVLKENKN